MRLDLDELTVQSFMTETSPTSDAPATGPEGPHSYCWICYDTDPGVPGCDPVPAPPPQPQPYDPLNPYRSLVVDSKCLCYS
jgi:hypothetical protein